MDKKRMTYMTIGFGILLLVVVILLVYGGSRRSGGIVLPETPVEASGVGSSGDDSRLNVIAISPETVQAAIRTLSRPAFYSRTQTVETFWSGGSGQAVYQVWASGGRTRLDTQMADGTVRHTLAANGEAAVWYDDEDEWTLLRAGALAADRTGRMLTYEAVLELPTREIAAADYRERDSVYCIYVETTPDGDGYAGKYWVSVENGLLYAAERTCNGELVYRFSAGPLEAEPPEERLFLLPDGSALA